MGLKFRRGSTAQQSGSLAFGEPYVNTTLGTLLVGGPNGDIILSSTGTGSTGNFGAISGSGLDITGNAKIDGNLTLGGTITIGDNSSDNVVVNADLSSSIIPNNDNSFDLGSTSFRYRAIHGTNIYGAINATNGVVSGSSQVIGILSSLNTYTGSNDTTNTSQNTSITNLNSATASLIIETTNLELFSGSANTRFTEIGVVSGSLISSASAAKTTNDSQGVSITNINTATASLNTSVTNLNTTTASLNTSVTNLNTYTSSLKTALSLSGADLTVLGNLTVQGDTTTLNTSNLLVEDKLIEIATGTTSSAAANGAGIFISGANASILWDDAASSLDINKSIDIAGNITLTGTVDGVDVSVLNTNINSFSSSQLGKDATLATLTASYDGRFTTLATTTGSLQTSVTNLNTFTASVSTASLVTSITNLNTFSSSQLGKDSTLATLTASYDGRFTTLSTVTASYDGRFTTLATYTGSVDGRFSTLATLTGSNNTRLTNLETTTASLNTSVSNLNSFSSSQLGKDSTLATLTASYDGRFTTLSTVTASYDGRFSTLATYTGSVDGRFSTLATLTGSNNTRLTNLETTTASLNTSVSNLNTFSGSANTRFTEIGVVSGSLITSASAAKTTNDSQGVSITNLNSATASLMIETANLETFSSSALTRLDNLEGKDISITLTGDVTGTGTITNLANVSFATTIAANSVALGTDTTGNYMSDLTQGTGVTITHTPGEGSNATIAIGQAVATSSNVVFNSLAVGAIAASGTAGRIDAAGDIVAFSTSDKNFKENIKPIENPIEKIRKISGNTYDWKEEMKEFHGFEGNDVGVIAQEIEAVLPQLVQTRDNGYKAVKYDKLVALLIEGIKEQQIQIDNLTLQVEELKKQKGL
jgi:hypothetical protein